MPPNSPLLDFRSDTVTRPTKAMLEAMTSAPLGDDVLGDDPTIHALQTKVASLFGKQAACFVPSGTMANQCAIFAHTSPGDEIICHDGSHILHYEGGGPAVLSGCMCRTIQSIDGTFTPDVLEPLIRADDPSFSRSRLLILENTHNRNGGTIWPLDRFAAVAARAAELGLKRHLDGARIWNACAASGHSPADYAQHVDTVSACFSKGLGCPIGSIVVGDAPTIAKARRARKLFGGAMRQAGLLAAAAIHALDHHRQRLTQDHANAKLLFAGLANLPHITPDPSQPAGPTTNILFFELAPTCPFTAPQLQARLAEHKLLLLAAGPRRIRMVTHLDVTEQHCHQAIEILKKVLT